MKINEILEVYVNDTETIKDIFKVIHSAQYELVKMEDESGKYTICIKKTGQVKKRVIKK